ncbi:MAG TPA: DEAD/DEAH box helicase [Firmicutes bacterium]|jgi:SNF2 family DNA or RNA helicase|nr:DEAD/DEAH box helicase [Bacillota bacterium]
MGSILTTPGEFAPQLEFFTKPEEIIKGIHRQEWDSWAAFRLRLRAAEISLFTGFDDELLIYPHLRERWRQCGLIPYPHQEATVKRVIGELRGRALLADEVGLGKTIEAGMIIKEYCLRGFAKKILILTPASLCRQWAAELSQKFALYPVLAKADFDWGRYDLVISSLDLAKQEKHRKVIEGLYYDLLVVDEAHKLKNPSTKNWQLVSRIRKKFFLLLTATPLQNDLKELFNLISLLRPGQLGSYRSFRQHFMVDKRTAKNQEELRSLLGRVMIRNKRGPQIKLPRRRVATMPLSLSGEETEFYRQVTGFVKEEYRKGERAAVNRLTLITLQREICSSSFAAATTLFQLSQKASVAEAEKIVTLMELAGEVKENTKMNLVEEILRQTGEEKVIIFTEFLATQRYIHARLKRKGILSLTFDGSMSASKKDFTLGRFRRDPAHRVLICTESGGEGVNLQFCRTMINYDLPWNPMRLEQRIGRIHRLGQTREVYVYNLISRGTIEEHLLNLLLEKVRLFEMVIGDLQRIVNYFAREKSFEARVMGALVAAENERELSRNLERLGDELLSRLARKEEWGVDDLIMAPDDSDRRPQGGGPEDQAEDMGRAPAATADQIR